MKKLIFTLILSFAIIGCEAPQSASADPDGRSLIDPTGLIEVADAFNAALNSGDIEQASSFLSEDATWSFPNGVTIEGKEAVTSMMASVNQIWTTIDQNSGDTVHLGVTGGEEGSEWKVLLSWGEATYSNDVTSISVPYHQVTWFTDDNQIGAISGLYDRTELVATYNEDPIK